MILEALQSHVTADPAVNALLGDRLSPNRAATDEPFAYATYRIVSGPIRSYSFGGPTGHAFINVQIDVMSSDPTVAKNCAEAIRLATDGFYGALGDQSVDVKEITVDGPRNDWEEPVDGDEAGVFRFILELRIGYIEETGRHRRTLQKLR